MPGSRACPACSQDMQETKPRNDVNDPRKGFPFLESLRRQMCAAAGRHSPTPALPPSKEQWGSGKHRPGQSPPGSAGNHYTPPGRPWEMRGPKAGATSLAGSFQAEQHNPPAPSKTLGGPCPGGSLVLCTNIPVLPQPLSISAHSSWEGAQPTCPPSTGQHPLDAIPAPSCWTRSAFCSKTK